MISPKHCHKLGSKVVHQGFLRPTCWKVDTSSEQPDPIHSL